MDIRLGYGRIWVGRGLLSGLDKIFYGALVKFLYTLVIISFI
jgi:hypothetical protein